MCLTCFIQYVQDICSFDMCKICVASICVASICVASICVASICVQAFIPYVQDGSDIEAVGQMCWMRVRCAGCVLDVQDACQMLHSI